MFSGNEMDVAACSGTGVFYQAMPAIGADGKNIMKLIPVQMVNRQFVQVPNSKPKVLHTLKKPVTIASALQQATSAPSSSQQSLRNQFSNQNVLLSPVNPGPNNSLNKHPPQQQTHTAPPVTVPLTSPDVSVHFLSPSPVTKTLPALPRGQSFQSPLNAEAHRTPPSERLLSFSKPSFTSSAISAVTSNLPSAGYISHVTIRKRVDAPPSKSTCPSVKLLPKPSTQTSCGVSTKGAKPLLKLIPIVSQRPNSPIKWVVEEVSNFTAPNPKASHFSPLSSRILQTVAERENSGRQQNINFIASGLQSSSRTEGPHMLTKGVINEIISAVQSAKPASSQNVTSEIHHAMAERVNTDNPYYLVEKTVSHSPQGNSGEGDDDVLVICNGRTYVVGNERGDLIYKQMETMTASEVHQQTPDAAAPKTRQGSTIPRDSDEVIDLCDDDTPDEALQDAAIPPSEEDNVIFVSYIPPKPQPNSTSHLMTKVAPVTENDQSGLSNSTEAPGPREEESTSVMCDPGVTDAATIHHASSNIENQPRMSTPQPDVLEGGAKTENQADQNNPTREEYSPIEKTQEVEGPANLTDTQTTPIEPKSPPMTDHQLRELFEIRADVKVCLMRIDEARPHSVHAHLAQNSLIKLVKEDKKPMSGLTEKELPRPDLCILHQPNVQIDRKGEEQELPSTPDTDITPLQYSHLNSNIKPPSVSKQNCPSGQVSCNRTSCDGDTQPLIGYMEPIDENFLQADQKHSQKCLDMDTNTKRMGRTRKRPMCPCCSPAISSLTLQKCNQTTPKTKKGRGQQLHTNDEQLSGRHTSPPAKNKSNCRSHHCSPCKS